MAVRYKFRSSVNFDSVDIDGRPSISIRDLKSKIVQNKKLNSCQDFDLVFFDALTSQEYNDESFQILSGSSVIIKRVPAGSVPSDMTHNGSFANFSTKHTNEIKTSHPKIEEINFDDFGVDLCPAPHGTLSCSDIDGDKKICIGRERENIDATGFSEPLKIGCQKLEASNPSELIPRGPLHSGIEENSLGPKSEPDVQQFMKLERVVDANPSAMQYANFPSELKCSLCNTLFKKAVMIPCCQHSFCDKCIRLELAEKARCPRCYSSKCRVEDLLPNVSLRQAIDHFLESQILICGSENPLYHYASDGESGIQAKDASCAMTNLQREPELPDSPSLTGRGSNQIVAESAYDSLLRNNPSFCGNHLGADKPLKSCSLSHTMKQIDGERNARRVDLKSRPADFDDFADCQGENQPIHREVEFSNKKRRGLGVNTSGRIYNFDFCTDKGFMDSGRHKKVDRTCYMCGSPDHLIRGCPAAWSPYPMLQPGNSIFPGVMPGYASHYWNGPPMPPIRPFANIYGNPRMMPFNARMLPATPSAVPVPSMFNGLPAYGGYVRMGGPRMPVGVAANHLSELMDHQECEKNRKLSNKNMSQESSDDEDENVNQKDLSDEAERLCDPKSHFSKERSVSYSEDSFTHRCHKRNRHDRNLWSVDEKNSRASTPCREQKPCCHQERSSSEVEDFPSGSSWHGDEGHKRHIRNSQKHLEKTKQCCSDTNWSRHPSNIEKHVDGKRLKSDVKGRNKKHGRHSDSGLEPSCSKDRKKKHREKDFDHVSRRSKHNLKFTDDKLSHDRWLMVRGTDKSSGEDNGSNKRKRIY